MTVSLLRRKHHNRTLTPRKNPGVKMRRLAGPLPLPVSVPTV